MRTAWKQLATEAWMTVRAIPQTVRQRLRPEPGRFLEPHFPPRWLMVLATCVLVALACILLGSLPSRSKPQSTLDLPADPQASNLKVDSRVEEGDPPPPEPPAEPEKLQVAEAKPMPAPVPPGQ